MEIDVKTKNISKITLNHYVKLIYRSLFFIAGLILYIFAKINDGDISFDMLEINWETAIILIIGIAYFIEITLRFFPSKIESMGCQKQFKRNYEPTGRTNAINVSWKRTFVTTVAWLSLNAIIGALYLFNVIDAGVIFLVSLAYGICDMICILFFCPFHTWFLKSRCCSDCRIYNWDFAMIFTPFVFILNHWYTAILLTLSLLLLLRWEITYKVHPEYFSRNTNKCLDCSRCQEKLCKYKPQLRNYLKKNKDKIKIEK